MALTSLLVCADAKAVQVLSRILTDLGIRVEHCGDPSAAASRLVAQRFDAILLDCNHERVALEQITAARKAPANRTALIIAMVDGRNQVREVFAKGANFALYKPISAERAGSSLRAARSLMRRERRRNQRVALHAPARIAFANTEDAAAVLLDLSDEGIALQSDRRLPPRCKVYFQFALPGQVSTVRLAGQVVWQDSTGRVGIAFASVPQSSRRVLGDWLRANLSQAQGQEVVPSPAAESPTTRTRKNLVAGLGLLSVSASDRREKSRHACRLGADVYRLGSSVPHRCSLSDISTGGCYVETTEPFPPASVLDIVVRTEDFKLRVRGTVQVMHPGFGMGVEFSLRTADEREQVKQLIACQTEASAV